MVKTKDVKKDSCTYHEKNPFVGIAASIAGIFCGITAIVAIFAKESLWVLWPIALCLAVMGIALGAFAYKSMK